MDDDVQYTTICSWCGKEYSKVGDLKRHSRLHADSLPLPEAGGFATLTVSLIQTVWSQIYG